MKNRYLAFYKPYNVLTQFTDPSGTNRRTLKDFINVPGVYPVGRLDRDSEGLLLLTDDGGFQHRLSEPRFEHPRTYWVQVEGVATPGKTQELARGVTIREYRTLPAQARILDEPELPLREPPIRFRKAIPTSWLELNLKEGRNRQVRRMTAAVGLPTLRLVRVAIAGITLGALAPGEWRDLAQAELEWLQKQSPV